MLRRARAYFAFVARFFAAVFFAAGFFAAVFFVVDFFAFGAIGIPPWK